MVTKRTKIAELGYRMVDGGTPVVSEEYWGCDFLVYDEDCSIWHMWSSPDDGNLYLGQTESAAVVDAIICGAIGFVAMARFEEV